MGFDRKVDLHCKFLFGELCQGETGVQIELDKRDSNATAVNYSGDMARIAY